MAGVARLPGPRTRLGTLSASRPGVLVVSPYLAPPPGGVQRLAMDIARALGDERVRIVGVSARDADDPRVRVVRQRSGRLGSLLTTAGFVGVTAFEVSRRPDVVQAMTWRAALPVFLVPRHPPVALFCHGGELIRSSGGWVGARLRRFVLRRASLVLANSEYTASLVRGLAQREAIVIHPPVGTTPSDVVTRDARPEAVSVLSVGRLVKNKGHDRLIRAVAAAREQGVHLRLTIASDGPEAHALAALVEELGLTEEVQLVGAVSDAELDRLYRNADLFALLSVPVDGEVEGFGIVFLEANSYGLPVVAGRSGGTSEAVDDGVTGFIVEGTDEAAAALVALASDAELRRKLGEAGRTRLDRFSLANFGTALRDAYARL